MSSTSTRPGTRAPHRTPGTQRTERWPSRETAPRNLAESHPVFREREKDIGINGNVYTHVSIRGNVLECIVVSVMVSIPVLAVSGANSCNLTVLTVPPPGVVVTETAIDGEFEGLEDTILQSVLCLLEHEPGQQLLRHLVLQGWGGGGGGGEWGEGEELNS